MAGGDFDTKINLNRILNKWGKKNSQIWKRFYTSTLFLELKIFSSVTVTTFSLAVKCRTVTQRKTGVYCPTSTSLTLSSFTLLNSTNTLVPVFHPFNDNTVPKKLDHFQQIQQYPAYLKWWNFLVQSQEVLNWCPDVPDQSDRKPHQRYVMLLQELIAPTLTHFTNLPKNVTHMSTAYIWIFNLCHIKSKLLE